MFLKVFVALLVMAAVDHPVKLVDTTKSLKLAATYKRNTLQEISGDGSLLLFYESSKPVRTYTIPLGGGRGSANQPDVNTDVLRVVERTSGRETGRVEVGFFPDDVQFIPGTHRVFYTEPKHIGDKLEWRIKIWDLANGEARECSGANSVAQSFNLIDAQHVLNILRQPGKDNLAILALPGCSQTAGGLIEHPGPIAGSISFSPTRKELAYVTGGKVMIRDTATLGVVREIDSATGMNWGLEASYTPDGKFLLVPATNTIRDQPDTKRFLYFYDTTNYQLARQLDITSWNPPVVNDEVTFQSNVIGTALAIAPDSRTMAVAYEKGRQPQVVLYDLETGKEVGRAVHPAVKESREDPFAARIGKLAFTPDGKYLFSSTHDTFVWEVPS
jgi:hypothetical protein